MSRGFGYALLVFVGLVCVALLAGHFPASSDVRPAAVRLARPRASATLVRPPAPPPELGLRLPPPWSRPSVRSVVAVLRTHAPSGELYTRSGSTEPSADTVSGSYATLRPNEMGTVPSGRLDGYVHSMISSVYTRAAQQEQNIASIPIGETCYRGRTLGSPGCFYLRCETAGRYVVALQLHHPGNHTFSLRHQLTMQDEDGHASTLLDRTDTVPAHAEYVVPALIQVPAPGWYPVSWETEVLSAVNPSLVLRAVTTDKIG